VQRTLHVQLESPEWHGGIPCQMAQAHWNLRADPRISGGRVTRAGASIMTCPGMNRSRRLGGLGALLMRHGVVCQEHGLVASRIGESRIGILTAPAVGVVEHRCRNQRAPRRQDLGFLS